MAAGERNGQGVAAPVRAFYSSAMSRQVVEGRVGSVPEPDTREETHPLFGKTAIAIVVMLALLAVPYASPRLASFRAVRAPWQQADPATEAAVAEAAAKVPPPIASQGELSLGPSKN